MPINKLINKMLAAYCRDSMAVSCPFSVLGFCPVHTPDSDEPGNTRDDIACQFVEGADWEEIMRRMDAE